MSPELEATIGEWAYIVCWCLVKIETGSGVLVTYECDACRNTNIRFLHVLENVDTGKQIQVGIECARVLVGPEDSHIPRLAENETKRKERWRREKYRTPGRCSTDIQDLEKRGKL
jgi:hypothetical protein